jgi:PAS domain S-box-containing protein
LEPDAGSAEDLRLALQAAGVGVWDVDAATGRRRWSPEMRAILGLDALTPADPALFTRLIHPEDREWVTAEYLALYRPGSGDTYDIECRVNRADDGALRWVALKGRVLRDEDGAAVRGIGTLTDITARKLAERTSSFQAMLLDQMTEGVSLSSEDGLIVFTNPAEDALFGYEPGELVGKHVSVQNAYPPEENEQIVAGVIDALKAGGLWEGEWRNVRKDGTEFYTSSRITGRATRWRWSSRW